MNALTLNADKLFVGDWAVEPLRTRISRSDEHRSVQPLSMDILVHLADHAGEVVTTSELLDLFWADRYAGSDAVHRRISDLRRKLGDDRIHPRYIETIRKRGYRLIARVRRPDPPDLSLPVEQLLGAIEVPGEIRFELELKNGRRISVQGTLLVATAAGK